jgi:hypothetical protein
MTSLLLNIDPGETPEDIRSEQRCAEGYGAEVARHLSVVALASDGEVYRDYML